MVKKTKKEKIPDAPDAPQEEQEPTPVIETTTEQEKAKKTVVNENVEFYKKNYQGMFAPADFGAMRSDSEICSLLFGILVELKKLNDKK